MPAKSSQGAAIAEKMMSTIDVEKKMKALNKKLKQIEELKAKSGRLDPEAQRKVDSESKIRKEIAALESPQETVRLVESNMGGKDQVSLLEEIEAVVADVPSQAALLLGESEQRFRSLLKTLRDTAKLLRMDKLDKKQHEKLELLKEDAPDKLMEFQPLRSKALELFVHGENQIEHIKREREKQAAEVEYEKAQLERLKRAEREAPVTRSPPPKRFASDVGGVLNAGDNDSDTAPVDWHLRTDSAVPDAKESVKVLVDEYGPDNFFIMSKCGPAMQKKTRIWLFETMRFQDVGLKKKNVLFCTDRTGVNGKGSIARGLGISHFVDDSDACLWSVYEEGNSQAAVEMHGGKFFHFGWGGSKRYPPRARDWNESERPQGLVTPVRNWREVLSALNLQI
jgi:hypothetical protein